MQHHDYVLVVVRNLQQANDDDYVKVLRKQGYRVEVVPAGEDPIPIMLARPPIAACFQFDYPDLQGLTDLRHAKQRVASVPMLMITQAHSEHLAVWAFRCRVWDYFVHPIDMPRFLAVLESLRHTKLSGNPSPSPNGHPEPISSLDSQNAIPHEARLRCPPPESGQAHIDRAITFIDKNLHRKIAQSEVADSCHLSTFQFSRLFKRLTGSTFQDYVLHRRITEAKRLLANPRVSITDVCFTVGFSDLSYFTRTFQRYVGQPPSRYRVGMTEATFSPSAPPETAPKNDDIKSVARAEIPEPDTSPYRS
ncbi:helix-turn-helix transcriptional regulator [Halomonas korlensis]|uniref:AraC-type DNA-binding protein n=1 Tax=Halomonas korlensis TaxID=463301 RepID=A0A1I7FIK6_9GAMM|nr:DNA-binding response regulator [Halomonas korlensis]SFU35978.1 AraC-type DNA-binding protein [Halomonas korlensis]